MIKFTAIALTILLLGACSNLPRLEGMVPKVATNAVIAEDSPLWKSTSIGRITGSEKTNKLWSAKISKQVYEKALHQSLDLHAILSAGAGKYQVSAKLRELSQPLIGIELAVTARIEYSVKRLADASSVFKREIIHTYTTTLRDSYVFSDRLKLANEGAIKANIKKFIGAYIVDSRNLPKDYTVPPGTQWPTS